MRLSTWLFALLVLIATTPALAQEEPLPAPPPDEPGRVQPPPQRGQPQPQPQPQPPPQYPQPYPQPYPQQYPQQYPPGYQPPPPGYQQPYYQPYPGYPGYPPPQIKLEPNRTAQRFSIYAELLGKTFLWGVGFDVNILSWLGLGVSGSYYRIFDWRLGIIAPYVNIYPVGNQKHALLIQAGPEIAVGATSGFWMWSEEKNSTYVWGQVSVCYEYRNHFLARPGLTFWFNQYGFIPWFGASLGGSF
jgi:hypothetical protein